MIVNTNRETLPAKWNNMMPLRPICTLLAIFSLAACDNSATPPALSSQQELHTNDLTLDGIAQLEARLGSNPDDFETLSALADMYFESSRYVDAFQTYDKAIAVNPRCADCYNDRGLCLFYLGDVVSALESFEKAVKIDPQFTHAWLSKGFVLTAVGRYQDAVEPLNRVKALDGSGELALQADKFLARGSENSTR